MTTWRDRNLTALEGEIFAARMFPKRRAALMGRAETLAYVCWWAGWRKGLGFGAVIGVALGAVVMGAILTGWRP